MEPVSSDLPPASVEEYWVPLPGQVHAAVSEAGGRIEVLSAGGQNQVNTFLIADPVLGLPLWGCSGGRGRGRSTAVHQLAGQVDVLKATGAQKAFCKYLGKGRDWNWYLKKED